MERRELLSLAHAGALSAVLPISHSIPAEAALPMSRPNPTTFPFRQLDVFSSVPSGGNPLAVVLDANALTTSQMAAFANWTNLSETAFLVRPTRPDAHYRVRIFTRQRELPFAAGHPTLGSCSAWLAAGGNPAGREILQECTGTLTRIRQRRDRLFFAAAKLVRAGPVEPDILDKVIRGLNLAPDAIVASNWVDNGSAWMAVMLRSRAEVLALRPDYPRLAGLHVGVVAPWNAAADGPDAQFEVRAFDAAGVGFEDPVTGSLNAGLAIWLIKSGRASGHYVASQGTALGRTGRVFVEQDSAETWIGGTVGSCIEGTVTL